MLRHCSKPANMLRDTYRAKSSGAPRIFTNLSRTLENKSVSFLRSRVVLDQTPPATAIPFIRRFSAMHTRYTHFKSTSVHCHDCEREFAVLGQCHERRSGGIDATLIRVRSPHCCQSRCATSTKPKSESMFFDACASVIGFLFGCCLGVMIIRAVVWVMCTMSDLVLWLRGSTQQRGKGKKVSHEQQCKSECGECPKPGQSQEDNGVYRTQQG